MGAQPFDLASFGAAIKAPAKERSAIRQGLVRGLKDYFEAVYGYDRYGAETIFQLSDRLAEPVIFGYACLRLLHDRRISDPVKIQVAGQMLSAVQYGSDSGIPHGIFAALNYLAQRSELSDTDLRYCLVATASETDPFKGVERRQALAFVRGLLGNEDLPLNERAMWAHSLIARHQDRLGAADLVDATLGADSLPPELRRELCHAWLNFRQPRIEVEIPAADGSPASVMVTQHMGFWVAHTPSWPSRQMVRRAFVWLARLGEDIALLTAQHAAYRGSHVEQIERALADVLKEQRESLPDSQCKALIDKALVGASSISTRRRFYRLGSEFFGSEYVERATGDVANSIRQWAARELQKRTPSPHATEIARDSADLASQTNH